MAWPLLVMGYVAIVTTPVATGSRFELGWAPLSFEDRMSEPNIASVVNQESQDEPEPWQDEDRDQDQDQILPQWLVHPEARSWSTRVHNEKRALSVLSRWKPFTSAFSASPYDIRRYAARSHLPPGVFPREQSRAQARPIGQPLRWGRRR